MLLNILKVSIFLLKSFVPQLNVVKWLNKIIIDFILFKIWKKDYIVF